MLSIGFIYWLIMLLLLIFGAWGFVPPENRKIGPMGWSFLIWLLLFLLGWKVFGWPISGG